ncbi:hypothetical protein G3A_02110 [Bacillus sp. 17376]|uniref:Transposase n=1 Tax=Mesobacillus boroniphilus JCM 21738 TaxID=1294265 RepID=W4RT89_9BACI|nr:hypothetical protein [Mesobacillus boroniphilus]ESU34243.1 hypothetical protein G3A_02110 [Bacillus sp. 17376]GAE47322.1 transposase [Mesobacillus boroniphilus JCM 21738]
MPREARRKSASGVYRVMLRGAAVKGFKKFNERTNRDECLEDIYPRRKLTDEQARQEIKQLLGEIAIARVKSLPGWQKDHYLIKIKEIDGITVRQAARILCVSKNLIHRAGLRGPSANFDSLE